MSQILERFLAIADKPYQAAEAWKREHKQPVIGIAPMYFPEELVHAAGILPIVLPPGDAPITVGSTHIFYAVCGFARSVVDVAFKGGLDFLDGLIFPSTCTTIRNVWNILYPNRARYIESLQLPWQLERASALPELAEELRRLKHSLEEFVKHEVSNQAIKQSIVVYNRHRSLLKRLYDLRCENPGVLRAGEMQAVVQSSMMMPKEEHSQLLERLVSELEGKEIAGGEVRLFLSGFLCGSPNRDVLDFIEEAGGAVVDDDLYVGRRYFADDAQAEGDAIEALAKRFVNMSIACPTRIGARRDFGQLLIDSTNGSRAKGIIYFMQEFCDAQSFVYPYINKSLQRANVSHILVRLEHDVVSLGGIKRELQTFVRSLAS